MAWQRVASISEIDADGVLGVDVDGSPVALYRLGNEVFATAGICTHALAILSDGFVEDGKIECPLHQGQFDIRSGKALCPPVTEDLRTYAVKLDGNDVCMLYDMVTRTPAGTAFVAEWLHVEGGKIASIRTVFDARPFAAMFGKK